MILNENPTYYDLLEVPPDASPQEIRSAYLRAKAAYRKDSVALYTLITEEETELLLRQIEEAYQILSHPEKRRDYDRNHGLLSVDEAALSRSRPARNQKIVSIDRVPPMESTSKGDDLLIPPSTDFTSDQPRSSGSHGLFGSGEAPLPPSQSGVPGATLGIEHAASQLETLSGASSAHVPRNEAPAPMPPSVVISVGDKSIQLEIEAETEWKGSFLKRVREAKKISLEELSDFTKVSRTYITAIEEENYLKLPAPVYLRGFVTQIAKYLKLPHEKVAAAYMNRYQLSRVNK